MTFFWINDRDQVVASDRDGDFTMNHQEVNDLLEDYKKGMGGGTIQRLEDTIESLTEELDNLGVRYADLQTSLDNFRQFPDKLRQSAAKIQLYVDALQIDHEILMCEIPMCSEGATAEDGCLCNYLRRIKDGQTYGVVAMADIDATARQLRAEFDRLSGIDDPPAQ